MNILLRRRKLGRGSTSGISSYMQEQVSNVRNFSQQDLRTVTSPINVLFRWGCTSSLRELGLPAAAITVNSAESISWCSNKKVGRLEMQEAGVPVPKTWGSFSDWTSDQEEGKKYVFRPSRHAQGRNLLTTSSWEEGGLFMERHGADIYISELIDKVAEYRVFVCQNRVVWVAQKTPGNPDQVAWNVAQGGQFDNVRWGWWPKRVIQAALAAAKVSGTDFCGVDVMVDAEGNPYVLEINSAPSQTSPYRQQCVAKVFDHIIRNGKDHYEDISDSPRRTWKSYIHPALWERGS